MKSTKSTVRQLENKLKELIEIDGIQLLEDDTTDVNSIFEEVSPAVIAKFPEDSP